MNETAITSVIAREVYSDRMKAAVQVTVRTQNGAVGKAVCTAGVSVGSHEARFLYDNDSKFRGRGVRLAVRNVNEVIGPRLIGMDASNQAGCDSSILACGKERMGANAVTAASSAVLNAGAAALHIPLYEHIGGVRAFTLPVPGVTAATGSTRYGYGASAGYKPTYSFVAYDFETYTEASSALWETFMNWSDYMQSRMGIKMQPIAGMAIPQGKLRDDFQLWEMLAEVIEQSHYSNRIGLQVDVAANCFYDRASQTYRGLFSEGEKDREDMIALIVKMVQEYPFVILEDPLMEDDFEGFAEITAKTDVQIECDDLTATDPDRLRTAIEKKAGNALRISAGQIGTFSEAVQVALTAEENDFGIAPCGERGEGLNACDYAVGLNAGTAREYGMCYSGNRFLQIEKELGSRAKFFGKAGIKGNRFQIRKA